MVYTHPFIFFNNKINLKIRRNYSTPFTMNTSPTKRQFFRRDDSPYLDIKFVWLCSRYTNHLIFLPTLYPLWFGKLYLTFYKIIQIYTKLQTFFKEKTFLQNLKYVIIFQFLYLTYVDNFFLSKNYFLDFEIMNSVRGETSKIV